MFENELDTYYEYVNDEIIWGDDDSFYWLPIDDEICIF